MGRYFRPATSLFPAMALVLAGAALLSWARLGSGDLPGADYFVFPFLHHGHGEQPASFLPGSWAVNFLLPSYLLSVIVNAVRGRISPLAVTGSPFFFYVWLPVSAIVEVAADTLVPIFVTRGLVSFKPLVIAVDGALAGAVALGHLCSKGAEADW